MKKLLIISILVFLVASVWFNIHQHRKLVRRAEFSWYLLSENRDMKISYNETEFDNELLQEQVKVLEKQLEEVQHE